MKTVEELNINDYCFSITVYGVVHIYKVLDKVSYAPRFPDIYEVKLLNIKTNKEIKLHNIPGKQTSLYGYSQIFYLTYDEIKNKVNEWISYFNDVKLEIENLNKD